MSLWPDKNWLSNLIGWIEEIDPNLPTRTGSYFQDLFGVGNLSSRPPVGVESASGGSGKGGGPVAVPSPSPSPQATLTPEVMDFLDRYVLNPKPTTPSGPLFAQADSGTAIPGADVYGGLRKPGGYTPQSGGTGPAIYTGPESPALIPGSGAGGTRIYSGPDRPLAPLAPSSQEQNPLYDPSAPGALSEPGYAASDTPTIRLEGHASPQAGYAPPQVPPLRAPNPIGLPQGRQRAVPNPFDLFALPDNSIGATVTPPPLAPARKEGVVLGDGSMREPGFDWGGDAGPLPEDLVGGANLPANGRTPGYDPRGGQGLGAPTGMAHPGGGSGWGPSAGGSAVDGNGWGAPSGGSAADGRTPEPATGWGAPGAGSAPAMGAPPSAAGPTAPGDGWSAPAGMGGAPQGNLAGNGRQPPMALPPVADPTPFSPPVERPSPPQVVDPNRYTLHYTGRRRADRGPWPEDQLIEDPPFLDYLDTAGSSTGLSGRDPRGVPGIVNTPPGQNGRRAEGNGGGGGHFGTIGEEKIDELLEFLGW